MAMSDSFTALPVIDVSALVGRSGAVGALLTDAERSTGARLHRACRDAGFFYVTGHGVSTAMQEQLLDVACEFFALPAEEKAKIAMRHAGRSWRGHFRLGGELTSGRPDQKEGLYLGIEHSLDHEEVRKNTPMHGPNQWPEAVPRLAGTVLGYMSAVSALGQDLLRGIAIGLGIEDVSYFASRFTDDPTVLFRMFNYPEHKWEEERDEWGVREHTDMGFLTVLKQDDCGGLQVKNRAGVWIEAPPIPNTFVVNIGDMLEVWTHGLYKATLHRVRNQAERDRMSFPLFFDPNWYCTLETIDRGLFSVEVQAELAKMENEESEPRWDGLTLQQFTGKVTYGEFVWPKISRVFPELASMPVRSCRRE